VPFQIKSIPIKTIGAGRKGRLAEAIAIKSIVTGRTGILQEKTCPQLAEAPAKSLPYQSG